MDSRPLACDAHIHVFLSCAGRCVSRCGLLNLINTRHARTRTTQADPRPGRTRRVPALDWGVHNTSPRLHVASCGLCPPWPAGPGSLCSATTPASNRVSASATLAGELGQPYARIRQYAHTITIEANGRIPTAPPGRSSRGPRSTSWSCFHSLRPDTTHAPRATDKTGAKSKSVRVDNVGSFAGSARAREDRCECHRRRGTGRHPFCRGEEMTVGSAGYPRPSTTYEAGEAASSAAWSNCSS